mgnify:FL=1
MCSSDLWAHENIPEDYYHYMVERGPDGESVVRDRLNRFHQKIYRALSIPNDIFTSDHDRGIYFAPLYTNAYEFLRNAIPEEKLIPAAEFTVDYLTALWKEKYARKRIENLTANGRISDGVLFYDDMSTLDWEGAKRRYLPEVGR